MTSPLDRKLIVVTGKGGVGKTTVAAALGIAAAGRGRRTIVCEVSGQDRIPALWGRRTREHGVEVALGDGLWSMTMEPTRALDEWLSRLLPGRVVHVLSRSNTFAAFVAAAPGAPELLSVTKAWELANAPRWAKGTRAFDTVIVDAPASGHGIGMLRTPRTYAEIARVGPIGTQARRVADALRDPGHTAYVAVAIPTELAVTETLELGKRLDGALSRKLDTIVCNAVLPRRLSAEEEQRIAAADGTLAPGVVRAARASTARVRAQQGQLQRLRRSAGTPVHTLPFLFSPNLELDDVRELARRLDHEIS